MLFYQPLGIIWSSKNGEHQKGNPDQSDVGRDAGDLDMCASCCGPTLAAWK